MTDSRDPLGGEISVEARLDSTGIKASAKSRILVALDRLVGSAIDIPGAHLEGIANRKRVENEVREELIRAKGRLAVEQISEAERVNQRARIRAEEAAIREQLNREAVAAIALEDLRDGPHDEVADGEIDDDWMNVFINFAERASSERVRVIWGKVLAGELRRPGSFSLTTLRVVSEVDQKIAQLFQEHAKGILGKGFLVKKETVEGQELIDLTFLEVGLLQEASGMVGLSQKYSPDGQWSLRERNMVLIAKGKPNEEFRIPVINITRAGQEILSILPSEPSDVPLRKVSELFLGSANAVELGIITADHGGGRISYQVIEKLR